MGVYLNSKKPFTIYQNIAYSDYFVDKSALLNELIPLIGTKEDMNGSSRGGRGNKYICITRPRRFGKTVMADMVASFFSRGIDSSSVFGKLNIHEHADYALHLNRHQVIYISLNETPADCTNYQMYITRIVQKLLNDLHIAFPKIPFDPSDAVWDVLNTIYEYENDVQFIFVFDEWDYIFHQDFVTDKDKTAYIRFLSCLLKDQPYVELAYITGILPIAKYSSGSELNMFYEYTMTSEERFSDLFGFTESEVDSLYAKYQKLQQHPKVTREGLKTWYDGYHTKSGERVYNPRSVVAAFTNNNLGNYWTSSGPYDEIFFYIKNNVRAVREDLALMLSGVPVPARIREYAATSMNLSTKNEIFSAMVVYGFLSYENGCVSVPNKELMEKFEEMFQKEASLGYVFRLAQRSDEMLKATLNRDTDAVVRIMEYAHHTESPLLAYNNESDLVTIVNLVYLSARDMYRMVREDKAGIGYVDFILYPEVDPSADGLILELKVNDTAEHALQQIKDKNYALAFEPKLGETPRYTGRILGVGIAYDKKTKKHTCRIEVLREKVY